MNAVRAEDTEIEKESAGLDEAITQCRQDIKGIQELGCLLDWKILLRGEKERGAEPISRTFVTESDLSCSDRASR